MLPIAVDSTIDKSRLPSPVRCSCPTKSVKVRGLSLSANGADSIRLRLGALSVFDGWAKMGATSARAYVRRGVC